MGISRNSSSVSWAARFSLTPDTSPSYMTRFTLDQTVSRRSILSKKGGKSTIFPRSETRADKRLAGVPGPLRAPPTPDFIKRAEEPPPQEAASAACRIRSVRRPSHVSPVPAAHFVKGGGDLTQAGHLDGFHQFREQVASLPGHLLQPGQGRRRLVPVALLERPQVSDLRILLLLGRPGEGQLHILRRIGVEEGVDADDRQLSGMFLRLVEERFLLDLAPLVHHFHRPEHAPAVADPLEFPEHGLLHQIGQFLDDEGS